VAFRKIQDISIMTKSLSRRHFAKISTGFAALALAGCNTIPKDTYPPEAQAPRPDIVPDSSFAANYSARPDEQFPLPAIDPEILAPEFRRTRVDYDSGEKPGTLIVDTSDFYLYLVEPAGTAMRYGVGLGRAGFEWSGRARVAWKRPWPKWTPPDSMIARDPKLEKWSVRNGGMPPGLENPLGARALYIFEGKVDTLYRLHGTNEPQSIGKAVSSGCVRMINQDAIDLYERVKSNAPILVT
jgi:lipoprotein-anchoring transpeptidase ErfK/SrfK